jgi:acetyltransferase-like isoleucine patch superfamily enzyme
LLTFLRHLLRKDLFMFVIRNLPGESGRILRRRYYSKRLRKCGANLIVETNVRMGDLAMIEIGDDVRIREDAAIHAGRPNENDKREVIEVASYDNCEKGLVSIGSNSAIGHGVIILGYGGVRIGNKCGIGPGAAIYSESFHYKSGKDPDKMCKYTVMSPWYDQCNVHGLVEMKDGAGLASNSIALPGSTIGRDSWVLPNSIVKVKGDIPDYCIARGTPAEVVKVRKTLNESKES